MPTIRTRSAKGSALTQAEADANFKKTVRQVTTTAATLISDNRGVVEGNHASTPFTITLLAVATAAAAEPGDYSVTISNIGAAAVTVDANSTETINGSTDTLTLAQYSSVRLEVDSAGTGWQITARTGDLGAVTVDSITNPAIVTKYKTADTSRSSTTTLADDDHLLDWTLTAASYYKITGYLYITAGAGLFKFQLVVDNAFQSSLMSVYMVDVNGNAALAHNGSVAVTSSVGSDLSANQVVKVEGFIDTHATLAGNLDLQWAQNSSNAAATVLKEGSWITLEKIS